MLELIVFFVGILGIMYAAFNYVKIKNMEEGTERMSEIASAIREGSDTFLMEEYKVLLVAIIVVTLVLGIFIQYSSAVAFIIGTIMSGAVGLFGMKASTLANVRVANTALNTKNIGKTTKVALRGGSVMGISVSAAALVGLVIVVRLFRGQLQNLGTVTNWCGISFEPFSMTLSSYALGCSLIAMFNRVGGGIYTKAADMGADLVGKTEAHIPEDDPRNPATIADNVGDNVGDVAGLGSDLLESYVASIVAAIALGYNLIKHANVAGESLSALYTYPLAFAALGLISCVVGVASLLVRNLSKSKNVHSQLNGATYVGAALTLVAGALLAYKLESEIFIVN